ncbi:bifunctional diguanylate cyclase/phosphodiesterase [Xanthobacter autotrophicus]|uniref:EAL domain-containing protein n=1 Tax=Xanthobacter autotrophicus TaxID=280 RepID=A0A6C1KBY3_XANAU|nr:bifunctional diguanylate cyclase/phosphodiesterase [Xanthobacter autotrophicus]TLX41798.1 EAL domain-containing protein [Xanthobacter autotrophicus]
MSDADDGARGPWKSEYLALHDPVTSLPNRLLMTEFLAGALSSPQESRRMLAVFCLDLDNFPHFDTLFGPTAGDLILAETARRIRRCVRDRDLVARVDAERFVVVATGVGDAKAVDGLARRLLLALNAPVGLPSGASAYPQANMGVSLAPLDAEDAEGLVRCAELALVQSKAAGPGICSYFADDMNDEMSGRRTLESDLRRAIVADEFVLLFQPRCDARSLKLLGVEALIRWDHPQLGLLAPDAFVPLAEKSGLVIPIGEWVLRKACDTISRLPELNVSVNVSVVQFRNDALVDTVDAVLKSTRVAPHRLELEITESVLIENAEKALEVLAGLKGLGVRLSMDDFGTGYSSLGYLRTFPFDALKIDRRFVGDLDESKDALAIVQAILGLGRALGLQVVAEGVETESQLAILRADTCDEVQGFFLGRPMTEEALLAYIADRRLAS